jgi:hypothetical protein
MLIDLKMATKSRAKSSILTTMMANSLMMLQLKQMKTKPFSTKPMKKTIQMTL